MFSDAGSGQNERAYGGGDASGRVPLAMQSKRIGWRQLTTGSRHRIVLRLGEGQRQRSPPLRPSCTPFLPSQPLCKAERRSSHAQAARPTWARWEVHEQRACCAAHAYRPQGVRNCCQLSKNERKSSPLRDQVISGNPASRGTEHRQRFLSVRPGGWRQCTGDQVIRENPASRGTEASAEVLVGHSVA